jgi:hypothetical protein
MPQEGGFGVYLRSSAPPGRREELVEALLSAARPAERQGGATWVTVKVVEP